MSVNFKYIYKVGIFFFTILTIYLIYPNNFYKYIVPAIFIENKFYLFGDWTVIFSAINCKDLGLNVFVQNPCDFMKRPHVYGSTLLFIPFFKDFSKIYVYYFPLILNIFFIIIVISHFKFNKYKETILYVAFIFSPSSLLAMERLNLDLIILMLVMLLCRVNSAYLRTFLIPILVSIKFYPAVLLKLFFLKKNLKINDFLLFLLTIFLTVLILYLDRNNIIQIFKNASKFAAHDRYLFSFLSISDYFVINNILLIVGKILIFILITHLVFRYLKSNVISKIQENNGKFDYCLILFLSGGMILCLTFLVFKNIYYREVFLFSALPYIIHQSYKHKFFDYMISFIIFRYIVCFLSNGLSLSQGINTLFVYKYMLDFILVAILFGMIVFEYMCIIYYKKENDLHSQKY